MSLDIDAIRTLIVLVVLAAALLWAIPSPCRCDKCTFHVNERRIAKMREEETRQKYKADQDALRHDYEHKGGGFLPQDPDRFDCSSVACRRNKRGKIEP